MAESRYEKYICRKPAAVLDDYSESIPEDVTVPHRHDYEEIFLFLGTNPQDTTDLGAEIDFWIGEGEERGEITFTTSSSIYIPPGTVHFP